MNTIPANLVSSGQRALPQWIVPSRVRPAMRALATTIALWRRRRRERHELRRLDDRTLKDIGLSRGAAEFLINKPFWRE